ncbi:outer membrane beta-barrel family protein [uncultured Bacteroides sp.]|uniref:outer membrane beta-barrel family protein n=1 Tax=uncultured Bacteroides sp. TaxID=162156 RepID=UPI00262D671B|nr:outer membrane beta-barrel family protein [uncultured Bacteroides sp.]
MKNKMMKLFIGCCLGWISLSDSHAQSTRIEGVVADSLTLDGEPYATLRIFNRSNRNKPAAMGVTDLNGHFSQTIKGKGKYVLIVSSVGRTTKEVPFSLNGEQVFNFDTLFIQDNVQQLKGVEVVARKPLVKMEVDRMSYSVSDDVDAKTNSVLDMLRKVPMVAVDGNDQITVNGSSSFKVYVDGKPNVMMSSNPSEIFKNMPATAIKRIEVITNPGARYDAEGTGGVLNLITDRSSATATATNGYNANVRVTASNKGWMEGGYFNMQQGKLSLSANINATQMKMKDMDIDYSREQLHKEGSDFTRFNQSNDTDVDMMSASLNAGYEIDTLNTLSASYGLMKYDTGTDGNGGTNFEGIHYPAVIGYKQSNRTDISKYSFNASLDFQHNFIHHPERMITLSYLLSNLPDHTKSFNYFDTGNNEWFQNYYDRYSRIKNNTWEHTWQADFSSPMPHGQHIDAGMKYILRKNSANSDYYMLNNGENIYDPSSKHDNQILAAYLEYRASIKRFSLTARIRYEHTWQEIHSYGGTTESFRKDYGNWVPNANISYSINEKQNIGATYNLRISRPGISYLNPYIDKSDPTALTYGNTDLESEEVHHLGLVYNYSSAIWNVNLTLRHTLSGNGISGYSFYQDNLLHNTYGNIVKSRQTGLNAFVNWNVGAKTRFMLNGAISYADFRNRQIDLHSYGWQGNIMFGYQQTLPWKLHLSLNIMSSTKQYNLQGWNSGFNAFMGTLSRSFCKERLNIAITGMTPLSGNKLDYKSRINGTGFQSRTLVRIPLQAYYFSISYTFGKQVKQHKAQRSIRNTDVINKESSTVKIGNMMVQ